MYGEADAIALEDIDGLLPIGPSRIIKWRAQRTWLLWKLKMKVANMSVTAIWRTTQELIVDVKKWTIANFSN